MSLWSVDLGLLERIRCTISSYCYILQSTKVEWFLISDFELF